MKKFTLTLLALLSLAFSATSQDTLLLLGSKASYHDGYRHYTSGDTIKGLALIGNVAYYHFVDDTLPIYGIAASLKPSNVSYIPGYGYNYADTSLDKVSAILRLYRRSSDSVFRLSEDLDVSLAEPPTFYMKLDVVLERNWMDYVVNPVYSVYERYFADPVIVTDSFFVGIDQESIGLNDHRHVAVNRFTGLSDPVWKNIPFISFLDFWDGSPTGWFFHNIDDYYPYIYPILTPIPDTAILARDTLMNSNDTIVVRDTLLIGGDTIVIDGDTIVYYDTIIHYDTITYSLFAPETGLLGRLVGVMPNPAGSTAKVVSSFGLTMVEAFNMAGERLCTLRMPDAPLTATLDVSRWPSGAYLLRIHTPQGVITKKLMVRR